MPQSGEGKIRIFDDFIGFEIDKTYYNIAQRRLKEHVPVKEVSHKKPTTLENLLY